MNKISIVLMQITPKMNGIMGFVQVVNNKSLKTGPLGSSEFWNFVSLDFGREAAWPSG